MDQLRGLSSPLSKKTIKFMYKKQVVGRYVKKEKGTAGRYILRDISACLSACLLRGLYMGCGWHLRARGTGGILPETWHPFRLGPKTEFLLLQP